MSKPIYIHNEIEHNTSAAEVIVPLLLHQFSPGSVLDVGCGIGTWLSVFLAHGITDVKGIDGDFIDRTLLSKFIDEKYFSAADLTQLFDLKKKFDLVISLEVAEHLPPKSAETFVASIVQHGDTILFSGATVGQGGQNHLNEQWPSYWADLFQKHGYQCYDIIRPLIWNDALVNKWYKQNVLVYSKKALLPNPSHNIDVIHPDYWTKRNRKVVRLLDSLDYIRDGKAGLLFYLKVLGKSLLHLGRKYKF